RRQLLPGDRADQHAVRVLRAAAAPPARVERSDSVDEPRHDRVPPDYVEGLQRISTGVPTGVSLATWSTSAACMRMQPCDAEVPTVHSSLVPWIPMPSPSAMSQARSGLRGSPGGKVWPWYGYAQEALGAVHDGFLSL